MCEHNRVMGSWVNCFMLCKCEWCQQSSFINSIDFLCLGCSNMLFVIMQSDSMVARHFTRTFNVPQYIIRVIVEHVHWNDPAAEFRRQYFRNVLLTSGSDFRLSTYFYNGIPGNISQSEDVIDLVLSFVVGGGHDRVVSRVVCNNTVW